jgi:hypothetical protein
VEKRVRRVRCNAVVKAVKQPFVQTARKRIGADRAFKRRCGLHLLLSLSDVVRGGLKRERVCQHPTQRFQHQRTQILTVVEALVNQAPSLVATASHPRHP